MIHNIETIESDIYLPKLQYLNIKSPLKTDTKGMTQMADILSRLSRLQTIILRFKPEVDYQPMKDMIIEKCVKIQKNHDFNDCHLIRECPKMRVPFRLCKRYPDTNRVIIRMT